MLDNDGHIIHIDFGFFLSNAPGKGLRFEKAPFKFTTEYLEVLGGMHSKTFGIFKKYMVQGKSLVYRNLTEEFKNSRFMSFYQSKSKLNFRVHCNPKECR